MEIVDLNIGKPCKMAIPVKENTSYPGKNVQDAIRTDGVWSKEESSILVDILQKHPDGLVVDVGSNTGYFSIISLLYGHQVIAIEANPIHTEYIEQSITVNSFDRNMFTYIQAFASDKKEDVLFDGWSGHDSIKNVHNCTPVSTVSITDICSKILFLKIDVEGAEPEVFKSIYSLIECGQITYIMFELTYIINNKIDEEQINILKKLQENSYNLYIIIENDIINITNISNQVNKWLDEYINCHKIHNPNLTLAGTNMIAVLKNNTIPNPRHFIHNK